MKRRKKKRPFVMEEKHRVAAKIFADGGYFSLQEVADKVGVCRQTLWRWWQRREFRDLCEKERRQAVAEERREWRAKLREERERSAKLLKERENVDNRQQKKDLIRWAKAQHLPPQAIAEIKDSFKK